jgi:hypothetical protein
VEDALAKKGLRLPTKCYTPLPVNYCPELDTSAELKADGVQILSGAHRHFTVGSGNRSSRYTIGDIPLVHFPGIAAVFGHLQQVYRMFGYLKQHLEEETGL